MLTDKYLHLERTQPNEIVNVQRIYDLGNGWGLSLVSGHIRAYPFAWEAAVLAINPATKDYKINYKTPLTDDVLVFYDDQETNEFIEKAAAWAKDAPPSEVFKTDGSQDTQA